ncbi:unnamed protein product [Pleuronectes platessa]|uniref:Uncharacterized protein n=1 Tax=Pleuronectes platessa TaxID=8262 RepID=A0A9N7YSD2_PLEPL|nr:unnamed protein product [Pleuronectes platessa]
MPTVSYLLSTEVWNNVKEVFGQRVGHTERAHFAGDRDAGSGRENALLWKSKPSSGAAGAPEPPESPTCTSARRRCSAVPAAARRASIPLHVRPDMNGDLREAADPPRCQHIQLARRIRGHRA